MFLILISHNLINKTACETWTYPCQVDSFKKTKQPSGIDILSVPGG